jgi:hypothetical protein
MPKTISQLPAATTATSGYVVAADNAEGNMTEKVTLQQIANLASVPVSSVAGKTGAVALVKADVGLGNVDNTSDLSKPISTATQTALDGKSATGHTHVLANVTDAGTAASRNVPASGDATSTQVVLGSDTRLTNSRSPSTHASTHRCTGADYPAPVTVTPAALSAGQNNWAPGTADIVWVSSSVAVTITGLLASGVPDGFSVTIFNVNASGGSSITLAHESSSSDAANRMLSPFGTNFVIAAGGGSATLVYHAASSRWRIL